MTATSHNIHDIPTEESLYWRTRSNTDFNKFHLICTYYKKAVLTKHLYVQSIQKKNIEFKFCDIQCVNFALFSKHL